MEKPFKQALCVGGGGALLLLALGFALGVLITQQPEAKRLALQLRTERLALQQGRAKLEAERAQSDSQLKQAQYDLIVERSVRAELEKNLSSTQLELGRYKDQLAFFEGLLPPGPQGALNIRGLEIRRQSEGLSYHVLLMRSGKMTERFVGALQFVGLGHAIGATDSTEQSVLLAPLLAEATEGRHSGRPEEAVTTACAAPEALHAHWRLDFEQFQRSQGWLAIPPGFALKAVKVRVLRGTVVLDTKRVDL